MSTPAPTPSTTQDSSERIESRWATVMFAIVVLLLGMVVFTGVHYAAMPPSRVELVDVTTLHLSGEFVESNLGTGIDSKGNVSVHVLAEQYAFHPQCLVVPEGVPVTFRATSGDVVHGFQIMGTNVNSMLVPGYVSTFVTTLKGIGERSMPCHEFCGVGHASMWAKVKVVPLQTFEEMARQSRRLSCV